MREHESKHPGIEGADLVYLDGRRLSDGRDIMQISARDPYGYGSVLLSVDEAVRLAQEIIRWSIDLRADDPGTPLPGGGDW